MHAQTRSGTVAHLVTGLAVAFGLSVVFWLALGVFNAAGFLVWSTVIGLAGGAIGRAWRRLAVTVAATAAIRIVHFIVMVYVL